MQRDTFDRVHLFLRENTPRSTLIEPKNIKQVFLRIEQDFICDINEIFKTLTRGELAEPSNYLLLIDKLTTAGYQSIKRRGNAAAELRGLIESLCDENLYSVLSGIGLDSTIITQITDLENERKWPLCFCMLYSFSIKGRITSNQLVGWCNRLLSEPEVHIKQVSYALRSLNTYTQFFTSDNVGQVINSISRNPEEVALGICERYRSAERHDQQPRLFETVPNSNPAAAQTTPVETVLNGSSAAAHKQPTPKRVRMS